MSVPKRSLFQRFQDFDVATVFTPKAPEPVPRTVFINHPLPDSHYVQKRGQRKVRKDARYATNQVVTSKYTVLTFLPRNLLEQFRRIANVFFAFINILQFFPRFATINPGLVILPLIIVLLITAVKDGYEDIKRHQSDRKVNHARVLTLEAEGYQNHNGVASKSKTFTRGMSIPFRRKKKETDEEKEKLSNGSSSNANEKHNADDDLVDVNTPKPHWRSTAWEDVRVGDFVKMRADQSFPGDIIICATSEPEDVCFVETKNLDGETNLKSRHNVSLLGHLRSAEACAKAGAFIIEADKPETNMYRLNAKVTALDKMGTPEEKPEPISLDTMLLRGTVLRNTDWVIGIVLFTGRDTKIVLNSGETPSKRSKVERQMNPMVFVNLALLAIVGLICSIADSRLEAKYLKKDGYWTYEEPLSDDNPSFNGFTTFFNALITFQNVVPISLYISIEFVRTCQAAFIYFDGDMYDEKADQAALSRSWNLSDDLGQVKFMVSDKTGTLTQNSMVFRKCSIGGKIYEGDTNEEDGDEVALRERPADDPEQAFQAIGDVEIPITVPSSADHASPSDNPSDNPPINPNVPHFQDAQLMEDIQNSANGMASAHSRALNAFMTTLALCHTAIAGINDDGSITYKAQSPDESALVQAAADAGYIFLGKDKDILKLKTPFSDSIEEYELLHVLDFTSARKRMSVVLRKVNADEGAEKRVYLLSKGADSVIIDRLKPGQDTFVKTTEEHLEYFASAGLRTLCLAYKVIPEAEYDEWSHRYHEATLSLNEREEEVEKVSDEMERGLRLLGATAIEDKLQDGVPETIADLKRAGIKIWVATGDKLETAISIGYSTNLIATDSNLIVVRGVEDPLAAYNQMIKAVEQFFPNDGILDLDEIHPAVINTSEIPSTSPKPGNLRRAPTGLSDILDDDNGRKAGGFILVIDGAALTHALEEDHSKQLLLQIGLRCEAVICCRVSPLQKAQIVHMIKDNLHVLTLAIGDGANDVSMIQAADIGVGISGEEGLQAVNSSDYAIAQFRYIKRLLLVHGHWSYARNANMIGNFFYKNLVIVAVLFWFQIYCAWSTTYVIDYTYLLFWNVFWSIAPVIAIGIFDRNIDGDVLMAIPELYRYGREGTHFGLGMFSWYMLDAVVQAAIVFFLTTYSYSLTTSRADGYEIAMYEYSATMVLATVMIVNLFNGLNTTAWTGWVFFSVSLGIVLVWGFTAIYSTIKPGWFVTSSYGNYYLLFHSVDFWLCLLLTIPLALLPRYIDKAVRFMFFPNDFDILRWIKKSDPNKDFAADPALGGKLKARHLGTQSQFDDESDARSMASSLQPPRRSFQSSRPNLRDDWRSGSRTDMSTGQQIPNRGFNFSTEESGIAIRRTQTNLSERYLQRVAGSPQQRGNQRGNHPYMSSAPALPRADSGNRRHSLSLTASLLRRSLRRPKEDEQQ